jgi:hypothetical protein
MEWFRHHPKAAAVCVAVTTLLVIAVVWIMVSPDDEQPATLGEPVPTAVPSLSTLTPLPTAPAVPTGSAEPTTSPESDSVETLFQSGLAALGKDKGMSSLPGFPGTGASKHLPRHKIVLRVVSEDTIGTVGYIMPTSLHESSGVVKNVGKSWSLTSTVYGDPDWAQIFVQARARGFPITCTITVDGRVTENRSTEGPYGRMVCQG